jgi:hypothetical protein
VKEFEYAGTRAYYRPVAETSFEQAVARTAEAIRCARVLGLADMLVNTTGFTGFTVDGVFARYAIATKWVEAAGPTLRLAIVARPEFVDPQKITQLMMQNRGTRSEVFTSERDALCWLDARPVTRQPARASVDTRR